MSGPNRIIGRQQIYTLHKRGVIQTLCRVRSDYDRRVRVDRYVVEYVDALGVVYRTSFEARPGVAICIPQQGTHQSLDDAGKQWQAERPRDQRPEKPTRRRRWPNARSRLTSWDAIGDTR